MSVFRDTGEDDPPRIINLAPEDFAEFVRIMEAPPNPNDKLIELLRGYTIVSQRVEVRRAWPTQLALPWRMQGVKMKSPISALPKIPSSTGRGGRSCDCKRRCGISLRRPR